MAVTNPTKLVAIGLLVVIGILSIVAVSTNYWYDSRYNHGGLWKRCSKVIDFCAKFDDLSRYKTDKLHAARAFSILAMVKLVPSGSLLVASVFAKTNGRTLSFVAGGILALQFVFQCLAVGMGGWWVKGDLDSPHDFGYSFRLAVSVAALYIGAIATTVSSALYISPAGGTGWVARTHVQQQSAILVAYPVAPAEEKLPQEMA